MEDTPQLPIGITGFADFIDSNMLYVDKTDLVANIARQQGFFFLSRPRRFGKSTLISTFHELFSYGTERFKCLKLEQAGWDDRTYPVVRLDFSTVNEYLEAGITFDHEFGSNLRDGFFTAKLPLDEGARWNTALNQKLSKLANNSLVLLIDEYDAPLNKTLNDPAAFADHHKTLDTFFRLIKKFNSKFRFVFVTGILEFSSLDFLSSCNIVRDLSFDSRYAAITGFTQQELEDNFKTYIENASRELSHETAEDYPVSRVLKELKDHYAAYSFDERATVQVYNPWTILNFMENPADEFSPYWVRTGGSQADLLSQYLNRLLKQNNGINAIACLLTPGFLKEAYVDTLCHPIENCSTKDLSMLALLYQTGYFTIKQADQIQLEIGIPNLEVRTAFADAIVKELSHKRLPNSYAFVDKFKSSFEQALESNDAAALQNLINEIFNTFSAVCLQNCPQSSCLALLKLAGLLLGYNCSETEPDAAGHCGITIKRQDKTYLIELKAAYKSVKAQEPRFACHIVNFEQV
ncbi:MAG: AAA family ATPase [Proteobacteria bacterium]|uniref:AAA family ATPase n=1 Tax=Candidatus Avisuccinivibrio stercorigallinarum TaxID=2840704 RepID=A0A9D9D7S1_9GAMM|nr:AAA family ATPase [Candidatus Avisuccinivibrio stercorigallinarum]